MARTAWQCLLEKFDRKWASVWNFNGGPFDFGLLTEEPWIFLCEIVQNGAAFMPLRLETLMAPILQRVPASLSPYRALSIGIEGSPNGAASVNVRTALAMFSDPNVVLPPVASDSLLRWDSLNEGNPLYQATFPAGVTWQRLEIPLSAWLSCNEPGLIFNPIAGPALPAPVLIAATGITIYNISLTLIP